MHIFHVPAPHKGVQLIELQVCFRATKRRSKTAPQEFSPKVVKYFF